MERTSFSCLDVVPLTVSDGQENCLKMASAYTCRTAFSEFVYHRRAGRLKASCKNRVRGH